MSEVVDRKAPQAQAASSSSALVSETRAFLVAWRRILSGSDRWRAEEIEKLRAQSRSLEERALAAGVGGLAHHLATCEECFAATQVDRDELSRRLRNVSELTSQLRQEIDAGRAPEQHSGSRPAGPPRPDSIISFPPRPAAEVKPRAQVREGAPKPSEPPPVAVAPPPLVEPAVVVAPVVVPAPLPAALSPAEPSPAEPSPAEPSPAVAPPPGPAPEQPPPPPVDAGVLSRPPSVAPPPPAVVAANLQRPPSQPPPPPLVSVRLEEAAPLLAKAVSQLPEAVSQLPEAVSQLPEAVSQLPEASPVLAAAVAPELAAEVVPELAVLPPKPARLDSDIFAPAVAAPGPSAPPARMVVAASYPPKRRSVPPAPHSADGEQVLADLDDRLDRIRQSAAFAPVPPSVVVAPGAGEGFDYSLPRDSERHSLELTLPPRARVRWWMAPAATGALAVLLLLVLAWRKSSELGAGAAATARAEGSGLPGTRLTDERERLRALLAQVHGHGGPESPELADLLDEEAALVARSLEEPCSSPAAVCDATQKLRDILLAEPSAPLPAQPAASGLGAWLSGLKLPGIGVKDDAKVRELVEYHTQNTVGREKFQVLLFQCGAYQDLIEQLLLRHELPLDLMALTMVESGCVADAESPVGARGLWQFMPATARAYHLRVRPGVIDERISPPKSTDAALKFLADLRRKLGSWELAMASYNMGPFGLIARLRQAGGNADYWDLAAAGRLPAETAAYVPKVQAFAVILANLSHFGFQAAQLRAPEVTAELEVPAGTRLGLVARAAGSSTTKIRGLNPDLLGDSVPDAPEESFLVRVPKEGIWRARESLPGLLADSGHADLCVPHSFDWGRQRFTKAMAERCEELSD